MPGYLAPDTLPHLYSNLADCLSDPGALTNRESFQAQRLHELCSPRCRVRQRLLGVHARALKASFDAHITADESAGSDCVACGQPRPCSSINTIFTPVNVLD